MAVHVRYPIWLRFAGPPGASVFATMYALESAARALLSTVIAIQALRLLHDARQVSLAFTLVGVAALAGSFVIPFLVRWTSRRFTYTLGALLLVGAAALLATVTVPGQIAGMLVRVFGAACLSVTTSLYIMQHIGRKQLTRSEPMRMQFSAAAWTLGPWLGVRIYESFGPAWAYMASAGMAMVLLALFWALRLVENPALPRSAKPPPSPIGSVRRFLAQPRLRLAWLIAFGRSCFWVFYFVYTPIYMIKAGFSPEAGALAVSAGSAMLFATPLFGRMAARFGLRSVLAVAFLGTGMAVMIAGLLYDRALVAVASLICATCFSVALDGLGSIPFIRSVRPHERPQMTTVYRTYLDMSELVTPLFFGVLLSVAELRTLFVVFGLILMSLAVWPRFLPRSM